MESNRLYSNLIKRIVSFLLWSYPTLSIDPSIYLYSPIYFIYLIYLYRILSDLIYLVLSMLMIFSYLPYHVICIVSCRIYLIYLFYLINPIYPIYAIYSLHPLNLSSLSFESSLFYWQYPHYPLYPIFLIFLIYPILSVTYTHADMHMQGRNREILRYFGMESAESWGCWLVRELMGQIQVCWIYTPRHMRHISYCWNDDAYLKPVFVMALVQDFQTLVEMWPNGLHLRWDMKQILSPGVHWTGSHQSVQGHLVNTSTGLCHGQWI